MAIHRSCSHAGHSTDLKTFSDLQIYHPHPASAADMTKFHAEDYIEFLQNVTPENKVCSMISDRGDSVVYGACITRVFALTCVRDRR